MKAKINQAFYQAFAKEVAGVATNIRGMLAQVEDVSRLDLTIEVDGRVHDGQLKIEFTLGSYGEAVRGGDLAAVLEEYLRRHGWQKRYQPLMIGHSGQVEEPEEEVITW